MNLSPKSYYIESLDAKPKSRITPHLLFPYVIGKGVVFIAENTPRIQCKEVLSFSGIRSAPLFSVNTWWLDGTPFTVEVVSDNPEVSRVIVTDKNVYSLAKDYFRALLEGSDPVIYDEKIPLGELTNFSGFDVRSAINIDKDGFIFKASPAFNMGDKVVFSVYSVGGYPVHAYLEGEIVGTSDLRYIERTYNIKVTGLASKQKKKTSSMQAVIDKWSAIIPGMEMQAEERIIKHIV